jgi:AraC-like DNA-binding protein
MYQYEEGYKLSQIVYSCYVNKSREGEQFVPDHVFSFQIAGSLILNDGNKIYTFKEGDFRFIKRNHLLKFIKQPPEGGEFKTITVYLDQETLRNFSLEFGYKSEKPQRGHAIIELKPDPLFKTYIASLGPYEKVNPSLNENLLSLKLKEAVFILLQTNPELKEDLFDFSEPGKIDLQAFMNKNFHFNVKLARFAYLSGRSLAGFKRDFEKIFKSSPSRWLQQKRLHEAHYLIKEKGKLASEVYLDLGFENLSHFSFAFKKTFGMAPSKI